MKQLKYIFSIFLLSVIGFSSCSESEDKVTVNSVCVQKVDDIGTEITKARLGEKIRIVGSGLSSTRAIFCNGKEVSGVNSNYITDNIIIFTLPKDIPTGSDVKNESDINTIRIKTKYDDFTFPFLIQGAAPSITGVSHTMPRAGERIEIYGTDLKDIQMVKFPGGVSATDFTVSNEYKTLSVIVPDGIGNSMGAISVEGPNGGAYSYENFNWKLGQFIWQFSGDSGDKAYNYGQNITGNNVVTINIAGDGPKNPDYYRTIPVEPELIPTTEKEIGGFNFYPDKAVRVVLEAINAAGGNASLNENTVCKDIAFQCDYYISAPWTSGSFRLELDGKRCSPLPWVVDGNIVPFLFSGFRTMTWPLSEFSDYAGLTLGELRTALNGKGGRIFWKAGTYPDKAGNNHSGIEMESAQMSFGNARIVPYIKPSYTNN